MIDTSPAVADPAVRPPHAIQPEKLPMSRLASVCKLFIALSLPSVMLLAHATPAPAEDAKPLRALLVLGGCCHDYAHQKDILAKGIAERANVTVDIAYDPDSGTKHLNPVYANPKWYEGYDVIIHDECSADVKDLKVIDGILKPHREGVPAVLLHCAMHCYRSEGWPKEVTPWFEFTGLFTTHHNAQIPIEITYEKNAERGGEILKGLSDWTTIHEELYINEKDKLLGAAQPLARGKQTAKNGHVDESTVAWTNLYNGKTRVFGTTLGHNNETCADGRYLDLVTRGLLWSVDKLDDAHLKPAKSK
jgi:type 1 glutamine amidotransferase